MPQTTTPGYFDSREDLLRALEFQDPRAAAYARTHGSVTAYNLLSAFVWEDTPQGFGYWSRLQDRLEAGAPPRVYADGLPY